ncbi:hypothetical protein [Nocardia sp. NPDC049149]|uniref:hypothetical protein n=1 Tax=Nocardia sp. NPDC049149 TaxID=3364315 RepID=UPI003711EF21
MLLLSLPDWPVGTVTITVFINKSTSSTLKEYSVADNAKPVNEQADDLEEPNIDGTTPKTV